VALLFLDSFDHYTTAQLTDKWTSGSGTITAGRHGNGINSPDCNVSTFTPASGRVLLGVAFNPNNTFEQLFRIGALNGPELFTLRTRNDGGLEFGAASGSAFSPGAGLIFLTQWHYIELDVTFVVTFSTPYYTVTASAVKAYVDGALSLDDASGLHTGVLEAIPTYGWNSVGLGSNFTSSTFDDFYLCDGSGPAPWNAPLGDVRISVIRPNGVGAATAWTPIGAATNYGACADLTPDDDTTKVTAATAGLSDLYQMEDLNTDNTIIGAQLLVASRRTEEGFANLAPLLRHAGVTTALPARAISPTYFYRNRDCFVTMPNGDPLTDANVNALQAGVRRTS
jgi:hypothetical protein